MQKLQASSVQIPGPANMTVVPSADFSTRAAGTRNDTRTEHRRAGYTFVEMMMALAIVAILAAVAIPSLFILVKEQMFQSRCGFCGTSPLLFARVIEDQTKCLKT
jgi:prepilin-type N-terminal cleavage/methylation domain-containing protein